MAFPSSPSDGQIYKNYKYNSTKGAWIYSPYINYDASGNVIITPESGERIVFDDQSEDSVGTYHPRTDTPSDWEIKNASNLTSNPGIWDLSSYVPTRTKAVRLFIEGYLTTTSEVYDSYLVFWDYDYGSTFSTIYVLTHGAFLATPYKPSTSTNRTAKDSGEFIVEIGSSRKLYYAKSDSNTSIYAIFQGYYI